MRVLADSYRTHLQEYSEMRVLDAWYARLDDRMLIATAPDAEARQRRKAIAVKARASVAEYLFPKISKVVDGRRRVVDQPPLVFHSTAHGEEQGRVMAVMSAYHESLPEDRRKLFESYRYQDHAFKAVGVGSVGTRCYVLLYLADDKDPLLLQAKEARRSVLEPYAGKSQYAHSGQRIVIGQRLMQAASDIFLGWTSGVDGTHYYIRQLRDMKFSVPLVDLDAKALANYAALCGWALARAHAKGGDAAMISGYLGRSDAFDQALGEVRTRLRGPDRARPCGPRHGCQIRPRASRHGCVTPAARNSSRQGLGAGARFVHQPSRVIKQPTWRLAPRHTQQERLRMAFNLRNRNFLKELDFTPEELKFLLKLSADLKAAKYGGYEVAAPQGQEHRPDLREDFHPHPLRV